MTDLEKALDFIKTRRANIERELMDLQNEVNKKAAAFRELSELQYQVESIVDALDKKKSPVNPQGLDNRN